MSSLWKKPPFTPRQHDTHWMNLIFSTHDLYCGCKDPILHLMYTINRDNNAPKPIEDLQNIKCLLTGITGEETGDIEDTGFGPGDLERLFAEDEGQNGG